MVGSRAERQCEPAERVRRAGGVAAWGDALARAHDIDDYYARAPLPIRLIERRRLRLLAELVGDTTAGRVLEIGCGGGHVLAMLSAAELVGVDPSAVMLNKARRRLAARLVTLHHGEVAALALPAASFDAIVCSEVLEHCLGPEAILAEMRRLLRPDGVAVVTLPNDGLIAQLRGTLHPLYRALPGSRRRTDFGGDDFHFHRWSIDQMRAMLSRHFALAGERYAPHRSLPIRCCFRLRARAVGAR